MTVDEEILANQALRNMGLDKEDAKSLLMALMPLSHAFKDAGGCSASIVLNEQTFYFAFVPCGPEDLGPKT